MTYAVDLAMIIVFGVPEAVVISCVGYLVSCLVKLAKDKLSYIKIIFNLSQFIITIFISGSFYYYLLDKYPAENGYVLLAAVVGALTYFGLNFSLVNCLLAY